MKTILPPLPLPEPLRASEKGTFTEKSVVERLPEIGRRTLKDITLPDERPLFPPDTPARLEALIAEIPDAPLSPIDEPLAPDFTAWGEYLLPFRGLGWLDTPWFFIENYFYRRLISATGYFLPGIGFGVDPFQVQKRLALENSAAPIAELCERLDRVLQQDQIEGKGLAEALLIALWGNQADLSLWPASQDGEGASKAPKRPERAHLLSDDSGQAVDYLLRLKGTPARIDILIDNAGLELVHDLGLVDVLLQAGVARQIVLHVKAHPVFVSDALQRDVRRTVDHLQTLPSQSAQAMGERFQKYLQQGAVVMRSDFFWTSPLPLWAMPASLQRFLSQSALLVLKGDANYRRSLGDLHWAFTTPYAQALRYAPAPMLALRVLKSEIVVGLQPGMGEAAAMQDATWLYDGHWGVIQFSGDPGI